MHQPGTPRGEQDAASVTDIVMEVGEGILAQDLLPSADRSRRVLAYEMMIATPAIRNGIRENKITQLENTMQVSAKDGMVLMDNYLAELYERCLITYDTAKDNQPANGQPARR